MPLGAQNCVRDIQTLSARWLGREDTQPEARLFQPIEKTRKTVAIDPVCNGSVVQSASLLFIATGKVSAGCKNPDHIHVALPYTSDSVR